MSKKAVICGIIYKSSASELHGCINDATLMKSMLINTLGFPEESILMLTEEEDDPDRIPTKKNIRAALAWLVQDCKSGDSLVFHYSGHGTSVDLGSVKEEIDGLDEALCPLDYVTEGPLVDNEINETIVRPLPAGVKLHAIIDACRSGTVLDLPYLCRMDSMGEAVWEDHRPKSGKWKGTRGGEVFSFSGCDDDQTSADTTAFTESISTGALTACFIQAIERGDADTYGSLLSSMQIAIKNQATDEQGNPMFDQVPQLTANKMFDLYEKSFSI